MFGALVAASASQSYGPPNPFVNVAVTTPPGATLDALTAIAGGGLIASVSVDDVPPAGVGLNTVTCAAPAAAMSAAAIAACSCVALT